MAKISPTPTARMGQTTWIVAQLGILCALLLTSRPAAAFDLSYGGRLTQPDGRPIEGPTAITLRFYDVLTGGSPKLAQDFPSVLVTDGIFQVEVSLNGADAETLLGDGSDPLYVEVVSQGIMYPRQRFVYAPLALRVPIDEATLTYNASGKLSVKPQAMGAVQSVAGRTGAITLSTTDITEHSSRQFFTDARARSALVAVSPIALNQSSGEISLSYAPLNKAGDTMSGTLNMNNQSLTGLATPSSASDAVSKSYADQKVGGLPLSLTGSADGKVLKYSSGSFVMGDVTLGSGVSGTVAIANGGTGATSASDAFDALSPLTTIGDLLYAGPSGTDARLPGNHSTTRQFLFSQGNGSAANAPDWGILSASDIPALDADKISSGTLASARINWAAPGTIGATTPNTATFISVIASSVTTSGEAGVDLNPFDANTGGTSDLRFRELVDNGSDYVGLKAPDNIPSSIVWTLPSADGAPGDVLTTDGQKRLSWTPAGSGSGGTGGPPTGAAGGDLTSIYPNPVVATVGGLAANSVASGAIAANAATSLNTASKIVRRDANGDFAAGTITANTFVGALTGNATNITGTVAISNGGTGATTIAAARTNLGLGTAATLNVGTAASNIVQLDTSGKLPAVDGSLLTNVVGTDSSKLPLTGGTLSGSLNLPTNGLIVGTDQLVLSGSNVGIGSSAPGAKLDVSGGGRFTGQNGLELAPYGALTGNTSELRFDELAVNGTNYVAFKAPNALLSNVTWTLPSSDGTSGYVLSTNGSGSLSWISPTTGSVTNIATGTGLTGGPITSIGTISLANVGTAGTYTKVTTNAQGQVTNGASLTASDIPNLDASKITSGTLSVALGGTGGTTAASARTGLGLGTASTLNVGTAASNLVQLDANAKLPAVDGTQLTGLVKTAGDTMTGTLNLPSNGLKVGTNQLVVSGGNVGIGTTSPSENLEVRGSVGSPATSGTAQNGAFRLGGSDGGVLDFGTIAGGFGSWLQSTDRTNLAARYPLLLNPAGGAVTIGTTTLGSGALNVMGGNVGIGTTNPASLLANTLTNSADTAGIGVNAGGLTWSASGAGYVETITNTDATAGIRNALLLKTAATDTGSYLLRAESGGVNRLSITAAGNVGIGTASPSAKLAVSGGAIVSLTNAAGAVNNVDWSLGNVQSISPTVAALTFTNMVDGGAYTLLSTDSSAFTHTFTHTGLTFSFTPSNGPVVLGTKTLYNFMRIGTVVYVTWATGL